jgi:hypothetical protein
MRAERRHDNAQRGGGESLDRLHAHQVKKPITKAMAAAPRGLPCGRIWYSAVTRLDRADYSL